MISFNRAGFTLLEMLVTVTIMLIITGGGIAGYIQFNERQTLRSTAKTIQTILRTAQKRAQVGDKPTGCEKLLAYGVQLSSSSSDLVLYAYCENSGTSTSVNVPIDESIPSKIAVSSDHNIRFRVLHGGVEHITGNEFIILNLGSKRYRFEVTTGGEISQGEFVTQ